MPELEEAARLDGASWPQIFWNVSLPMMKPIIAVALVLRGIDIVTMFTSVFIITERHARRRHRDDELLHLPAPASSASTSATPRRLPSCMLVLTVVVAQSFVKRFFRSGRR